MKLQDEWEERCQPSGGFAFSADPVQRRNGRAPIANLKQKLLDTAAQAKQLIGKEQVGLPGLSCKLLVLTKVAAGVCVTEATVAESLALLAGVTKIGIITFNIDVQLNITYSI